MVRAGFLEEDAAAAAWMGRRGWPEGGTGGGDRPWETPTWKRRLGGRGLYPLNPNPSRRSAGTRAEGGGARVPRGR